MFCFVVNELGFDYCYEVVLSILRYIVKLFNLLIHLHMLNECVWERR